MVDNYAEFKKQMELVENMFRPQPIVEKVEPKPVVEENTGFSDLLSDLNVLSESVEDLLLDKGNLTEARKNKNKVKKKENNADKEIERTHQPKPLPRDCEIVLKGRSVGPDEDDRHVFVFNKLYWSWDRKSGEWEVFSMQRIHLKVASPDGTKIKDRVKGRVLKLRGDK